MADPTTSVFGVPLGQVQNNIDPMTALQARMNLNSADDSSHHYIEQSGKHKGVAGTARDILGTLGDFLLTRLHMKPMYGPGEEDRKLVAAQQGFNDDPMAAIDRVSEVDPTAGFKLRDQYNDNQRSKAALESTAEYRAAREQTLAAAGRSKALSYVVSGINSTNDWTPDKLKRDWPALRNQMVSAGKRQGYDFSEDLPEVPDPDRINPLLDAEVGVKSQRAQWLTQQRDENNHDLGVSRVEETTRHDKKTEDIGNLNAKTGEGRLDESTRHNKNTEEDNRNKETDQVVLKTVELQDKRNHARNTEPIVQVRQGKDGKKYKFMSKDGGKTWGNTGLAN